MLLPQNLNHEIIIYSRSYKSKHRTIKDHKEIRKPCLINKTKIEKYFTIEFETIQKIIQEAMRKSHFYNLERFGKCGENRWKDGMILMVCGG